MVPERLGSRAEIGSIEVGKRADLILLDRSGVHLAPDADPCSTVVYAARGSDVRMTMVDGEILVDEFALARLDPRGSWLPRRAKQPGPAKSGWYLSPHPVKSVHENPAIMI